MNIGNLLPSRIITRSFAFVFFIFPLLVLAQKEISGNGRHLNLPDTVELARDIPYLLDLTGVPGMSLAVVKRDSIYWSGGFGTINDSIQNPVNKNTVFEAASMSKPLFTYIVLRLVDRGEFDLDQPLYQLLEHPFINDERYRKITGRMVLTHSTGLPNWGNDPLKLKFDPGTGFGYSGEAFVYLQKVIETITNKSLQELAEIEVFRPLGMDHSSFNWQERFEGNAAYAKNWFWEIKPITKSKKSNAAASLLTTASDYGKFVAAVLNGTGLSSQIWKSFLTPHIESDKGIFFGLGIGVEDTSESEFFFHGGNNGRRFSCFMVGDLQEKEGLIFLTNSTDGITLGSKLIGRVLKNKFTSIDKDGVPRYDTQSRLISVAIQKAAVEKGEDSARDLILNTRKNQNERLPVDEALYLAEILKGMDFDDLALEVLKKLVEDDPASANAFSLIGEELNSRGEYRDAILAYRQFLKLQPENEQEIIERLQWAKESLNSRTHPATVSRSTMNSYVGQYGARSVRIHNDALFYQREGNEPSRLIPITEDLFVLEESESFRIRFVREGKDLAQKIIGLYLDGRKDESERTD